MWKIGVTAAIGLALIAPTQARSYHVRVASELAMCTPVGDNIPPYIFPAPDWRPFFTKHMYVTPVITCWPTVVPIGAERVLSVKY